MGALLALLLATTGTASGQEGATKRAGKAAAGTKAPAGATRTRAKQAPQRATVGSAVPRWAATIGRQPLADTVASLVRRFTPANGTFGLVVVSLTTGDTLVALDPDTPMLPASTMKLFTSALAFERLGPAWQFRTEVLRDGPLTPDGTVLGNLYVRGDGDPSMSSRLLGGPPDIGATLLAARVSAAGVRAVDGDLVGDATAFDGRRIPDGWRTRYLHASYAAPVSALSLNENVVWVGVRPAGRTAEVFLQPASSTLGIRNRVQVVAGREAKIRIVKGRDGGLEVSGTIGSNAGTRRYEFVLEDPALFTTGAVRAALGAAAIPVRGGTRLDVVPPGATPVTDLVSPAVAAMVHQMNGESINHIAELLFRAAARGRNRLGVGSAEAGNAALQQMLTRDVGVAPGAVYAADGSGLSILDRSTPRALVQLLAWADARPWSAPFHESLPVAGVRETLRNRMRATPAQGNLHAKTGTTNEVASLAGYVTTQDGERLAFAALYNGPAIWRGRALIDAVGGTLAAWRRAPAAAEAPERAGLGDAQGIGVQAMPRASRPAR